MSEEAIPGGQYRREAIGAFTHDIRTPLTSIRMVLELAKGAAEGGGMVLDSELAAMLESSVGELVRLADDLQELSWLERGKTAAVPGHGSLSAAFEQAMQHLAGRVAVACDEVPAIAGPWDEGRLGAALEACIAAANRCGDGTGRVACRVTAEESDVRLILESGRLEGESRPVDTDFGFAFFRANAVIEAMGGGILCDRRERSVRLTVTLPR